MKDMKQLFGIGIKGKIKNISRSYMEGSQGIYIQYNHIKGIKIILKDAKGKTLYLRDKNELKSHSLWLTTKNEFEYLKQAEKSLITPKAYGLTIVKINGCYYPGIIMQHIHGEPLYIAKPMKKLKDQVDKFGKILLTNNSTKGISLISYIKKRLKKYKIQHLDLNSSNILITKSNKFKVIDFGLAKKISY